MATDRKLVNDLNTNKEKCELSDHMKKGSDMFPQKDEAEIFERKAGICRSCLVIIRKFLLYIGALISFVNFTGDLLYLFKAPFYGHLMWPFIGFLSARYLICMILACVWMKRNEE